MKIGVIIVTYNALLWEKRCLEPLARENKNGKVYIIDNGSTDGTQNVIRGKYPDFTFYQSDSNLGFGKANNLGFKLALEDECTNFLLLNQDASITWDEITYIITPKF
jgi:N-acetylglucosaminyl-diphospho-decaprenol L-rhamnosyltransferase